MLPAANPAFDFFILELIFEALDLALQRHLAFILQFFLPG